MCNNVGLINFLIPKKMEKYEKRIIWRAWKNVKRIGIERQEKLKRVYKNVKTMKISYQEEIRGEKERWEKTKRV